MKQTLLLAALGLTAFGAAAQEVGNVISSQPVVQQVATPRQVCNNQVVQVPNSGGGALLGGITGAAVGSAFGGGSGRAAALGVGAILGAVVGSNVEAQNNTRVVPNCITENSYENRTVAWNVTYEYAGRQYTTQMPYDPGRTVRLNVSPAGASTEGSMNMAQGQVVTAPAMQGQAQVVVESQPQYVQGQPQYVQGQPQYVQGQPQYVQGQPQYLPPPAQVVYSGYPYPYPAYPVYRPYYPPISLSFGYVYGGGHRHWR
jgi:uncharacterized protein YcfJ